MICAIVLAAGRSQRMGTQKLLLPFAGATVIARAAEAFLGVPVDQTLVVIRQNDPPLRAALSDRPVIFVENLDPHSDMLGSVRCGLRALPAAAETILVSLGDLPFLDPGLIRRMLAAFGETGQSILVPVQAGRRGHPLVFSARFREEILTTYDGAGLRGLLQAHPGEVFEWPTVNAAVLEDIDTPADYQRVLRNPGAGEEPGG